MRMNLKLDITDAARNALACQLAGKQVKRLAGRDEFTMYVNGLVAGLEAAPEAVPATTATAAPPVPARHTMTPWEKREAQRLRDEGCDEGFIWGWLRAGRVMGRNG